jgi:hypothetical protein
MAKRIDLYHEAARRMAISPDACIERIRRCSINSKFGNEGTDPASLAAIVGLDEDWGAAAFAELRSTGFIKTDWARFKWHQPSSTELDEKVAELAGIEAAAIVRLASMDCAPALPAIRALADDFLKEAERGDAIATSLAHHRMMLAIVSATGELRLMEDYVKHASVAVAYAVAGRLEAADFAGMKRSANVIANLVGTSAPRDCAAEAVAMRLHPKEPVSA